MKASVLKQYHSDPAKALEFTEYPTPELENDEVLVKIIAASLNPIDARIRAGYGKTIFSEKAQLPYILGRDYSGLIVKTGKRVKDYVVGDMVFGVVSPFRPAGIKHGSHAEYVSVLVTDLTKKPGNITHIQATSLPYVALTSYSALISHTGMQLNDYAGLKVFVQAGAGGIGSYAIQFLKAIGAHVTTTCSTKNIDYVRELGADEAIDYTKDDYRTKGPDYDVVFDLLGKSHTNDSANLLKSSPTASPVAKKIEFLLQTSLKQLASADAGWDVSSYKKILSHFDAELSTLLTNSAKYSSIVSPMMPLTDQYGLHIGMQKFTTDTLNHKANQAIQHGRLFNYSFFEPNHVALQLLAAQINSGKIKASIDTVFPLADAAKAHSAIETNRTRGKIVIGVE